MITAADVLIIAPELGTPTAQARVPTTPSGDMIVADVLAQLDASRWGPRYDMACKYLAAHRWALTLRGAMGQSGAVVGESVGGVSRQYAQNSPMGTSPDYDLTPYGKQYKALLRGLVGRIGLVV